MRSRTTYLYLVLAAFLSFPFFDGARTVISRLQQQSLAPDQLRLAIQGFMNVIFEALPLVLGMLICSVFATYAVTIDKNKRTLESLLATPLSLRQVWLGKSLAVALPSVIMALVVSLVVVLVVNVRLVAPVAGSYVMPSVLSWVAGLVIVPLLVFVVVCLVTLLQLIIANPRIATFVFTGIFLAVYMGTITEATASWNFAFIFLVIAVFFAALVLFLARFLTKERVVLSSKG